MSNNKGTNNMSKKSNKKSNNSNKFVTIVILNDGETFTEIDGCSIWTVPADEYKRVCKFREVGIDGRFTSPVFEIGLDDTTLSVLKNAQKQTLAKRLKELADSLGGDDGALVSEAIAYMEGDN